MVYFRTAWKCKVLVKTIPAFQSVQCIMIFIQARQVLIIFFKCWLFFRNSWLIGDCISRPLNRVSSLTFAMVIYRYCALWLKYPLSHPSTRDPESNPGRASPNCEWISHLENETFCVYYYNTNLARSTTCVNQLMNCRGHIKRGSS